VGRNTKTLKSQSRKCSEIDKGRKRKGKGEGQKEKTERRQRGHSVMPLVVKGKGGWGNGTPGIPTKKSTRKNLNEGAMTKKQRPAK